MMNQMSLIKLFALYFMVLNSCNAQIAIVAGAKSSASTITLEQVSNLYLGKTDQIQGVGLGTIYDLPEGTVVREQFYSRVLGKSPAQVKAIWSRLVFSGKGTPPKEAIDQQELKRALVSNLAAIGYVEKSQIDNGLKVLLIIE